MNDGPQNPWEQSSQTGGQGWQPAPPTNQWAQQPPQPQYQYQYGQPAQSRSWMWVLLAIALAVIIATVGVAAWLFGWFGGGGTQASGPVTSTYTSTVQVAPGQQADAPGTTRTTEPRERERGDRPVPSGSIPANSAARDNAPTGDFNSVWRGTTVTSEPFANAVRDAFVRNYNDTGDTDATLSVFSSVTGQTYTMTCRDNGSYVTCTGGNNAVVHIS